MTNPTTDPNQTTTPAADLVSAVEAFVDAKIATRIDSAGWNPESLGGEIQCRQRLIYLVSRALRPPLIAYSPKDAQEDLQEAQDLRQAIDEAERDAVKWEKAAGELEERLELAERRVGELEDQIVTNQKAEAQHFAAAALLEQHGYTLDVLVGEGRDSIWRRMMLRPSTEQEMYETQRALRTWQRQHAANKEGDA